MGAGEKGSSSTVQVEFKNSEVKLHFYRVLNDLSESCRIDEARQLFDKMPERDEFSSNFMVIQGQKPNQYTMGSLLRLCSRLALLRRGEQIHGCYAIKTQFDLNVYVVVTGLVDMCAKSMCILEAEYLFRMMPETKNHVMCSCSSWFWGTVCSDLNSARMVLENMEVDDMVSWNYMIVGCVKARPFEAYRLVNNVLVDVYAKQESLNCASELFNRMPNKDVVSWTSLVRGYVHNDCYEEALKLFCGMKIRGIHPDQVIVASILSACAELTVLEFGQQVHANFMKSGLQSSLSVDNSILTTLPVGYAQNDKGRDAVRLYDEMIASGTKPDYMAFLGLPFACSHAGLSESGRHYACMIDLSGCSGKHVQTEELLNQMAVQPDAAVWKNLLAACRVHANKWEDTEKIRRLMKSREIYKEPGCSWIETNSRVHTFMSEDRIHPKTAEIYAKIDEIMLLIKEAGYVPDFNSALHDTDEKEEDLSLACHSEKLAVAFAILTVPHGAPIRDCMNLRVCVGGIVTFP
ncbi:hypothetical protein SLEP1_g24140 [Rubroshorea leprosula]|uniref:EGF-like domain-containing protein n=1 Tax=Rubroshorea leprosula TaxID=152421 RepID=A0AAV5JNZ3_9ROSI|nr:hypothetical protein SLEP1_g24140 [Rubroshorea leprosula]